MIRYTKEELVEAVRHSYNLSDVCIRFGKVPSTNTRNSIRKIICKNGINTSHFDIYRKTRQRRVYQKITKKCLVCNNEFQTLSGHKKEKCYCSYKCGNSLAIGNRHSLESHRKISLSLLKRNSVKEKPVKICGFCEKEFRTTNKKFCSQSCATKFLWLTPDYREKIINQVRQRVKSGTHQGWSSRNIVSYPEKFFKKVLELNGFRDRFIINHPVRKKSIGIDCQSNYFLDFYFPETKIDLEIDGKQHSYPERRESDRIRDEALNKHGYLIHRIKWMSLRTETGKKYMKKEIDNLFSILENRKKRQFCHKNYTEFVTTGV